MGWWCGCSGQSGAICEEVRSPRDKYRAYRTSGHLPDSARQDEEQKLLTTREYQARDRLGGCGRMLGGVGETIRLFTEMIS